MDTVSLFLQPEHTVVSVRLIIEGRGRQITFINKMSQVKHKGCGTLGHHILITHFLMK